MAGSVAAAIATAAGAILGRNRRPTAAIMSADGYTEMLTNGANEAGFFIAGLTPNTANAPFSFGTVVSPFGIPVYVDPEMPSDDLVVIDGSAFKVYFGEQYRVDTSSEAGSRWDANLTGFRGELEMAFDARPGVYAGGAQLVADILS